MADSSQNSKTKEPQSIAERLQEVALKQIEKRTQDAVDNQLQSGVPVNDLLNNLAQSLGVQTQMASQIPSGGQLVKSSFGTEDLSKLQVPIEGSRQGALLGLFNTLQGKGFDPLGLQPRTRPLSGSEQFGIQEKVQQQDERRMKALGEFRQGVEAQLNAQMSVSKEGREEAKFGLDMLKEANLLDRQGKLTPEQLFTKYEIAVKDFSIQRDAYLRIQSAGTSPSQAGDIALIFGYLKLLDPTSTVREGEFATVQNAGNVGQKLISMYNRALGNTRLSSSQRKDFLLRANKLFTVAEKQNSKVVDGFVKLGESSGIPADRFIRDVGAVNIRIEGPGGKSKKESTGKLEFIGFEEE